MKNKKTIGRIVLFVALIALVSFLAYGQVKKSQNLQAQIVELQTKVDDSQQLLQEQSSEVVSVRAKAEETSSTAAQELQLAISQIQSLRAQAAEESERLKVKTKEALALKQEAEVLAADATERAQAAEEILFKAEEGKHTVWRFRNAEGNGWEWRYIGICPDNINEDTVLTLPICRECERAVKTGDSLNAAHCIHPPLPGNVGLSLTYN
jgi:primosomal protein N'